MSKIGFEESAKLLSSIIKQGQYYTHIEVLSVGCKCIQTTCCECVDPNTVREWVGGDQDLMQARV
jgi:hypothetical protein